MLLSGCEPAAEHDASAGVGNALTERLGGDDVRGFARAMQPRTFVFPADHGPHPDYRNEWWYLTGNLETAAGRRFGYQVTFFRIAIAPPVPPGESRRSHWATRQIWMAHVALSDAANRRHQAHERFARGAVGMAGARAEPFRVWLEDWQLQAVPGQSGQSGQTWQLQIETDDFSLDFTLEPVKPIVLQGDAGLSRKSAEPGNASFYYSMPRLDTKGAIRVDDEEHSISGFSWLDREWSTSALGEDQAGWDWFAVQLDDGRDLMFYRLRRRDGSSDPHGAGTLIAADGSSRRLRATDVTLMPLRWWHGPDGVRYPVSWRLGLANAHGASDDQSREHRDRFRDPDPVPAGDGNEERAQEDVHGSSLDYRVEAVFDDQRMNTSVNYWEGMVDVFDAETGAALGRGYLELAGYE